MTRDDLFKINAGIVRTLVEGIAEFSPKAFILVISNPVNSTVPIAAEVMKKAGVFDAKRLFGVTTLDVVRAETFVQGITRERDPAKTVIPVIGGHSGETIVPLFSLASPAVKIPEDKLDALVKRKLMFSNIRADEMLTHDQAFSSEATRWCKLKTALARPPCPWRTLDSGKPSSAVHDSRLTGGSFAEKLLLACKGQQGIVEPTYVYLSGVSGGEVVAKETGLSFFSVPVELGVGRPVPSAIADS